MCLSVREGGRAVVTREFCIKKLEWLYCLLLRSSYLVLHTYVCTYNYVCIVSSSSHHLWCCRL